jgi:hypothetical protein
MRNREIPLDVLNPEVREILKRACHGKDAEDYVFTNPDTDEPFYDTSARVWRSLAMRH